MSALAEPTVDVAAGDQLAAFGTIDFRTFEELANPFAVATAVFDLSQPGVWQLS